MYVVSFYRKPEACEMPLYATVRLVNCIIELAVFFSVVPYIRFGLPFKFLGQSVFGLRKLMHGNAVRYADRSI